MTKQKQSKEKKRNILESGNRHNKPKRKKGKKKVVTSYSFLWKSHFF